MAFSLKQIQTFHKHHPAEENASKKKTCYDQHAHSIVESFISLRLLQKKKLTSI